ncbi:Mth938-like domain-containing protein [Sphingomonas sp. MMS24-J45]|uniref:Mth938-like domain-containing protein n=1 Tax=Sphingomonas sp. MMS24-J45 TaxID=3238806 RepID=UPI00384D1E14
MRIDAERGTGPIITGLSASGFKVEAGSFKGVYRALTISPEGSTEWTPPPIEALDPAALGAVLDTDPAPEFLLLGTGATLQRPSPAFIRALEARGIGVEAMDSRAAARAWAVLRGEGRWVIGAFYPL